MRSSAPCRQSVGSLIVWSHVVDLFRIGCVWPIYSRIFLATYSSSCLCWLSYLATFAGIVPDAKTAPHYSFHVIMVLAAP